MFRQPLKAGSNLGVLRDIERKTQAAVKLSGHLLYTLLESFVLVSEGQ
jgi:hypothetical protein